MFDPNQSQAWMALPADTNQYMPFIIQTMAQKIPEITRFISRVEFSRMDPIMGDMDGLVYLKDDRVAAPIVIRGGRLAPIDVIVDGEENFYPLSLDFLSKLYANNVIGEASKQPDPGAYGLPDGPAYQVRYFNTLGSSNSKLRRKSAAALIADAPHEYVMKLASALQAAPMAIGLLDKHYPETLQAIFSHADAPEKVAAAPVETLPDLIMLGHGDHDDYYLNGAPIDAKVAGDVLSMFKVAGEARYEFLSTSNSFICKDMRPLEKIASVIIPESNHTVGSPTGTSCIADVIDRNGFTYRGVWLAPDVAGAKENKGAQPPYFTNDMGVTGVGNDSQAHYGLFIGPDFYSMQQDIALLNPVPIDLSAVIEASTPSEPCNNMFGIVASKGSYKGPMLIAGAQRFGKSVRIVGHAMFSDYRMTIFDGFDAFYEIPSEQKHLKQSAECEFHAMPGELFAVKKTLDGGFVFEDKVYDHVNMLYHLMSIKGLDAKLAESAVKQAADFGQFRFKMAAAAPAEAQPVATPDPQQMQPPMMPKHIPNAEDIDAVAQMNNPNMLDTYLSSMVAGANASGREQIMEINNDLQEALRGISKLLYLSRLGNVPYIKEDDARIAMGKLTDIAGAMGTQVQAIKLPNEVVEQPLPEADDQFALREAQADPAAALGAQVREGQQQMQENPKQNAQPSPAVMKIAP